MIDSFTEITGAEWYSFCSKDQCRWLDVQDLTVNDKEYGQGAVTNVRMRENGSPIINIFFESHHGRVQFDAESFQETEVSLWVSDSQAQIIRQEAKEALRQQNKNNEKIDLLTSVADLIKGYRTGEIRQLDINHVDQWLKQFDAAVQLPLLREINHVLKISYFTRERVAEFFKFSLDQLPALEEEKDPCSFWRHIHFLNIQGAGNSQKWSLELFNEILQKNYGFGIDHCGGKKPIFLYLDDGIFTGNRLLKDIKEWITDKAPMRIRLLIVSIVQHTGGQYYAEKKIKEAADLSGKDIKLKWLYKILLENRKSYSSPDILRPTSIPADPVVKEYIQRMKYPPTLRNPGKAGGNGLYSSDDGKIFLEQEFLRAGVRIRQSNPNLGSLERPLGHDTLDTLGFGSMFVTFRNCPNNAPLVLWAGEHALFPRRTNAQTALSDNHRNQTKSLRAPVTIGTKEIYYDLTPEEYEEYKNDDDLSMYMEGAVNFARHRGTDEPVTGLVEGSWWKNEKRKWNFKNGYREGLSETYHENGQLSYRGNYKQGKEDGLHQVFYKTGQMFNSREYKDGELNGVEQSFHENGKIGHIVLYENGEEKGVQTLFDENGNPVKFSVHKDGEEVVKEIKYPCKMYDPGTDKVVEVKTKSEHETGRYRDPSSSDLWSIFFSHDK